MNLHFVDNLTDAYDFFTTNLLTADDDFIAIGKEMDWQLLVNKAAEVESKVRTRDFRNHSAYIVRTSNRGMQVKGLAVQTSVAAQQIVDAEKALREMIFIASLYTVKASPVLFLKPITQPSLNQRSRNPRLLPLLKPGTNG